MGSDINNNTNNINNTHINVNKNDDIVQICKL